MLMMSTLHLPNSLSPDSCPCVCTSRVPLGCKTTTNSSTPRMRCTLTRLARGRGRERGGIVGLPVVSGSIRGEWGWFLSSPLVVLHDLGLAHFCHCRLPPPTPHHYLLAARTLWHCHSPHRACRPCPQQMAPTSLALPAPCMPVLPSTSCTSLPFPSLPLGHQAPLPPPPPSATQLRLRSALHG